MNSTVKKNNVVNYLRTDTSSVDGSNYITNNISARSDYTISSKKVSKDKKYIYNDINTTYLQDTSLPEVHGNESIENALRNLITTPVGSVAFVPEYGSSVLPMLFDNMNPKITSALIDLENAIERWLPPVVLYSDYCVAKIIDPQTLYLRIVYSIKNSPPTSLDLIIDN